MARQRPWRRQSIILAALTSDGRLAAAALLLLAAAGQSPAAHGDSRPFYLRNQNPFLQVLGAPALEGGRITAPGTLESRLALGLANHADRSEEAGESIVLDGESYYVDTRFRYGLGERWEIGLDLPYVAHRAGLLDNIIEGWHETFGLDNSEREGPSNHLQLTYRRGGAVIADLRDGGGGLGDVRLTGAVRLLGSADERTAVAMRGVVELPTGNEAELRGSGGTDVALGLEASHRFDWRGRSVDLYGQAGALAPGKAELLADQQKDVVPYGAMGAMWRWRPNIDLRAQLAVQGEYVDSRLNAIGGSTVTLAVGGALWLPQLGIEIDLALVEDMISDATPDFGLYLAIRRATATQRQLSEGP